MRRTFSLHAGRVGIERGRRLAGPLHEQRDRAVVGVVRPAHAGLGRVSPVARPGTRHTCSPGTPRGWRLVAITRSDGERPSSATISSAHPPTTCSQLSSASSIDSGSWRASVAGVGSPLTSPSSTLAATTWATSSDSSVVDRSTHQAPPMKSGRIASASAMPKPRLAGATWAGQGQHARTPHEGAELSQGRIPAH